MSLFLRFVKRYYLLRIAAVALLLVGSDAGAFYYSRHRANGAVQSREFPRLLEVSRERSFLVVAPHCDDETLGAGGLIHQAVRAGARVRVVFLTNGDGFSLAVSRQYRKLRPSRRSYIQFAQERQEEALAALAELGVPRGQVTFLGYPDRGLEALWNRNWSPEQAYRSPFTGCTRSPYADSYRPGAVYCGSSLLEDLRCILREEAPTDVVAPHPGDDHPDHWAGHCFTLAALRASRVSQEGQVGRPAGEEPRLHTYLVHRGDWPVPQGLRPEARLVPPSALLGLDTRWGTLPLDTGSRDAKARALDRYQSQMAVMRRFLQSFVRADELFGAVPVGAVPFVTEPGAPAPLLPVIADCREDTLLRELNGSVDLVGLAAAVDAKSLRLRLEARARLSRQARYRVRIQPLRAGMAGALPAPIALTFRAGRCDRPGVQCRVLDRTLEAAVPLDLLGRPREILLGAETELARVIVDRVSWRALRLPEPAAMLTALERKPGTQGAAPPARRARGDSPTPP
jgi:LmbE family N-acetylglucosaminyl deacetylase